MFGGLFGCSRTQGRVVRRTRARSHWSTVNWAASLAISALWHLLVLAVLVMAVHPFQLPDANRPISVELLPPLPPVDVYLRPRQVADEPAPPRPLPATPKPPEAKPSPPALDVSPEIQQRAKVQKSLQSVAAAPRIPDAPPAPLDVARPAPPAQEPPLDVRRAPPAPQRTLEASRPALVAPAPQDEARPAPPPPVQVLTSDAVITAPVEIRARDRTPIAPRQTSPSLPDIPVAPAPPPGGATTGQGGVTAGGPRSNGVLIGGGFGDAAALRGLRTTLGCANPETYRLTAEEREACLQRLAHEAKAATDLGPNIPAAKQAEYDRYTACRRAYNAAGISPSGSESAGTTIRGLGPNPSPRDCGPGDR